MKELRRRIGKTFERHQKIFDDAVRPLTFEEKYAFLDTYYSLPGLTDYLYRKSEKYDRTSGESFNDFINRNILEYKTEYEKKNKSKLCR